MARSGIGAETELGTLANLFGRRLRAWGLLQDRFGRVRRSFTADIDGRLDGQTLILQEAFVFGDGARSDRCWRIWAMSPGRFAGEADDIVGRARGRQTEEAVIWRYRMRLPVGKRQWTFAFHDWMYPQADGSIINRVEIRKFGVRVADLTIMLQPAAEISALKPSSPVRGRVAPAAA
jgi:hypothetical protein